MRSVADLLRDLRDSGAHIHYQNCRGTVEGRPVIWRQRFVEVWGEHTWVSFIYGNWPPTSTFQLRSHVLEDLSIDPITSVEALWEVWEDLKSQLDQVPEPVAKPERAGQLDMFDLLGAG